MPGTSKRCECWTTRNRSPMFLWPPDKAYWEPVLSLEGADSAFNHRVTVPAGAHILLLCIIRP